jgi:phage tail protein X
MSTTYTTRQGDTWDVISKRVYGSEIFMHELIAANFLQREVAVFSDGVVLEVPEIDTQRLDNDKLPVWKRQ